MNQLFYYQAYGLNIESSVFCPELMPGDPIKIDVRFRLGTVPQNLNAAIIHTPHIQINQNQVLIQIKEVGTFLISQGQDILIELHQNANENTVRLYLLGMIMGILLHQRQFLVLHGSAIAVNDACVIFTAPSGFGKSTLAGAFYKRGFHVVTDDICALEWKENKPYIFPSMPQIKLWEESIKKLDVKVDSLRKILPDKNKFAMPLSEKFIHTPIPVKHIYEIIISDGNDFQLKQLQGTKKFPSLHNNIHHKWVSLKLKAKHFEQCALLGSQIPVTQIMRPKRGFRLEELVDFLLTDFA